MNDNSGNGKLDALRKREAALREAINKEKVRQQNARARLEARETSIVGDALCKYAAQSSDFKLMLKQVLATAALDEAARKFLVARGWL
ncbi:MAG: hypothetical protein WA324_29105 [Bryobacteraceae bacterium]